jgi:hypothetical protein
MVLRQRSASTRASTAAAPPAAAPARGARARSAGARHARREGRENPIFTQRDPSATRDWGRGSGLRHKPRSNRGSNLRELSLGRAVFHPPASRGRLAGSGRSARTGADEPTQADGTPLFRSACDSLSVPPPRVSSSPKNAKDSPNSLRAAPRSEEQERRAGESETNNHLGPRLEFGLANAERPVHRRRLLTSPSQPSPAASRAPSTRTAANTVLTSAPSAPTNTNNIRLKAVLVPVPPSFRRENIDSIYPRDDDNESGGVVDPFEEHVEPLELAGSEKEVSSSFSLPASLSRYGWCGCMHHWNLGISCE